jgi:O-antigen ligase
MTSHPTRRAERIADLVGFALAALALVWVGVVAGEAGSRRSPVVMLVVALVLAVGLGRWRVLGEGTIARFAAVGIAGAAALTWPGMLQPAGPPTGYANANATLMALGALAALRAAQTSPREARRGWMALAAALATAVAIPTSVAGLLVLLAALALLGLSASIGRAEVAVVGAAILTTACLGVTMAIALGGDPLGLAERSGVRGDLWAGAVELSRTEQVRGVGPGRFADLNPVTEDRDLRWAHHGYLQVAAEWGIPGLVLVLAGFGWAWGRLLLTARHAAAPASIGAAALLVVALHGTVDYVWHIPVVLVVAALLVGDATRDPEPGVAWRPAGATVDRPT